MFTLRTIIIYQQIQLLKLPRSIYPLISSCAVLFVFRLIFFLKIQHFFFRFKKKNILACLTMNHNPVTPSTSVILLSLTAHFTRTLNKSNSELYKSYLYNCVVSYILLNCTSILINLGIIINSFSMVKMS